MPASVYNFYWACIYLNISPDGVLCSSWVAGFLNVAFLCILLYNGFVKHITISEERRKKSKEQLALGILRFQAFSTSAPVRR